MSAGWLRALARLCVAAVAGTLLMSGVDACGSDRPPTAHAWVTDTSHVLGSTDQQHLADMLRQYHEETHHQIAVLIVPTIGDESIDSFSLRTANAWRLGDEGIDNGILVTLALKEKRARIELGKGMERYISNADAKQILDGAMLPSFAKGDFAGGLERGIQQLMAKARAFVVRPPARPGAIGDAAHEAPRGHDP